MRAMTFLVGVCAVVSVAACGSSHAVSPDAAADAPPPDTGPPLCSYTEAADPSNDTGAEPTGLSIGAAPTTICGTFNPGHFVSQTSEIDADTYRLTVSATAGLVIELSGSRAPDATQTLEVNVLDDSDPRNPGLLFGLRSTAAVPDRLAYTLAVPPGAYLVAVRMIGSAALTAALDYRLRIAPDAPTRCAAVTAPAAYREAADGAGTGNDVLAFDHLTDPNIQLTADTGDAAEPTGLTIDGDSSARPVRISGTAAKADLQGDYFDRDTFLVRTAATTNELTLRLGWVDAQNNLDYRVFPVGETEQLASGASFEGNEEYNTIAVNPDTSYWIWIGAHDGSTALPATYDLTVCGGSFVR